MKTNTIALNFVRAQKAVRPTQAEIAAKIELANEKYKNLHRHFLPEPYIR